MKLTLALFITLFTLSANGSSLYAYSDHYDDINKLFEASTLVVRGTVKNRLPAHPVKRVYKQKPHNKKSAPLMTPFLIEIDKILRWQVSGEEKEKGFSENMLTVLQSGGISQHYDNIIFGAPLMGVEAEVLLFLKPHINPGGQSSGKWVITGMNEGIFLIEGSRLVKIEGAENGVDVSDQASVDQMISSLKTPPINREQ